MFSMCHNRKNVYCILQNKSQLTCANNNPISKQTNNFGAKLL